jgi:hypothetical protein
MTRPLRVAFSVSSSSPPRQLRLAWAVPAVWVASSVLHLAVGAEQKTTLAGYITDIKPPQIEIMVLKKAVGFWEPIKLFGTINLGDSLSIEGWCNKNSQVLSYVLVHTSTVDVRLDCSQVKVTFTEPGRFIPLQPEYIPSTPAIITEVNPSGGGSAVPVIDRVPTSPVRQLPTQTVTLSGTVATLDRNKRIVNIKKADGSFETVDVPPGAQRFDELKVGDKVSITFNNNVSARLKPPGEAPVDTATKTSTAGQGERPEGTASVQRTITATIDAIDKNASSITFVGPNGWKYSRHIVDPTVLDKVQVGDKVDLTWNIDVTVAVQ